MTVTSTTPRAIAPVQVQPAQAQVARPPASGQPRSLSLPGHDDDERGDSNHRSAIAGATVGIAMGAGIVKGLAFDRIRVLTALGHNRAVRAELVARGEVAKAATVLPKWGAELLSGKLTNDVVPIKDGVVRLGGRVITTQGFLHSNRISNAAGQGITLLNLSYAVPNLVDGFQNHGGWNGLLGSRSGRTGVFGLTANVSTLGLMGIAFARAPKEGGLLARMGAALGAEWLSSNKVVLANMVPGVFTTGNELGAFDWLNSDGKTSLGKSLGGIPGTAWERVQQAGHAIGSTVSAPFS